MPVRGVAFTVRSIENRMLDERVSLSTFIIHWKTSLFTIFLIGATAWFAVPYAKIPTIQASPVRADAPVAQKNQAILAQEKQERENLQRSRIIILLLVGMAAGSTTASYIYLYTRTLLTLERNELRWLGLIHGEFVKECADANDGERVVPVVNGTLDLGQTWTPGWSVNSVFGMQAAALVVGIGPLITAFRSLNNVQNQNWQINSAGCLVGSAVILGVFWMWATYACIEASKLKGEIDKAHKASPKGTEK